MLSPTSGVPTVDQLWCGNELPQTARVPFSCFPARHPPGSRAPHPQQSPCQYPTSCMPASNAFPRGNSSGRACSCLWVIMPLGFDPTGEAQLELLSPGTLWPGEPPGLEALYRIPLLTPFACNRFSVSLVMMSDRTLSFLLEINKLTM